jgi:site-specific recombinase XerC
MRAGIIIVVHQALADAVRDYKQFLRTDGRAQKTLTKYEKVSERLLDLAGRRHIRSISEVNLKFMDAYRSEQVQAGTAPKTLYTESVIMRQVINFALLRDMLTVDPLRGLRL